MSTRGLGVVAFVLVGSLLFGCDGGSKPKKHPIGSGGASSGGTGGSAGTGGGAGTGGSAGTDGGAGTGGSAGTDGGAGTGGSAGTAGTGGAGGAGTGNIIVVSRANDGTIASSGANDALAVSNDGRYVVFESAVKDLVSPTLTRTWNFFLRDITSGTTKAVHLTSTGAEPNGDIINTFTAGLSDDGRYVAFVSAATDFVGNDANGVPDVFRKDLSTGALVRDDESSTGVEAEVGAKQPVAMTATGDAVFFDTDSTNINDSGADTNGKRDIYEKSSSGSCTQVSLANDQSQANDDQDTFGISSDGRYLAFASVATNLVANDTTAGYDIYLRDTSTNSTIVVSTDASGTQAPDNPTNPVVSDDGRYVAFLLMTYSGWVNNCDGGPRVMLKDLSTGSITCVDARTNGTTDGNAASANVTISRDGRYLAYTSAEQDIVAGCNNGNNQVYVVDIATGKTACPVKELNGNPVFDAKQPILSGDGKYIVFLSGDQNLVTDTIPASSSQSFRIDNPLWAP